MFSQWWLVAVGCSCWRESRYVSSNFYVFFFLFFCLSRIRRYIYIYLIFDQFGNKIKMEIFNCWFELNLSTRYFWFSIWKLSSFSFLSGAIVAVWWFGWIWKRDVNCSEQFGVGGKWKFRILFFYTRMGQSGDSLLYFSSIILAKCFFF